MVQTRAARKKEPAPASKATKRTQRSPSRRSTRRRVSTSNSPKNTTTTTAVATTTTTTTTALAKATTTNMQTIQKSATATATPKTKVRAITPKTKTIQKTRGTKKRMDPWLLLATETLEGIDWHQNVRNTNNIPLHIPQSIVTACHHAIDTGRNIGSNFDHPAKPIFYRAWVSLTEAFVENNNSNETLDVSVWVPVYKALIAVLHNTDQVFGVKDEDRGTLEALVQQQHCSRTENSKLAVILWYFLIAVYDNYDCSDVLVRYVLRGIPLTFAAQADHEPWHTRDWGRIIISLDDLTHLHEDVRFFKFIVDDDDSNNSNNNDRINEDDQPGEVIHIPSSCIANIVHRCNRTSDFDEPFRTHVASDLARWLTSSWEEREMGTPVTWWDSQSICQAVLCLWFRRQWTLSSLDILTECLGQWLEDSLWDPEKAHQTVRVLEAADQELDDPMFLSHLQAKYRIASPLLTMLKRKPKGLKRNRDGTTFESTLLFLRDVAKLLQKLFVATAATYEGAPWARANSMVVLLDNDGLNTVSLKIKKLYDDNEDTLATADPDMQAVIQQTVTLLWDLVELALEHPIGRSLYKSCSVQSTIYAVVRLGVRPTRFLNGVLSRVVQTEPDIFISGFHSLSVLRAIVNVHNYQRYPDTVRRPSIPPKWWTSEDWECAIIWADCAHQYQYDHDLSAQGFDELEHALANFAPQ